VAPMTVGTSSGEYPTPGFDVPTPHDGPAHDPKRRRTARVVSALAIASVLVLVVGALAALTHQSGPVYPDHWDPRVAKIAHFVENERDLTFRHPVSVYFLTPKQYSRAARGDESNPTASDRADSKKQLAELRAFGVVEGDPDLLASGDDLADAGTLAFYDFRTKVVNVRGHQMTPGLRVTLAHELTHALQDQHFTISRIVDGPDSEASDAARSVVEGDAVDIEDDYVQNELTDSERTAYEKEQDTATGTATDQLGDVPDFLTTSFGAPYAFGPTFVSFFGSDADGTVDNAKVDALLRDPPPAMSRLFDPTDQLRRAPVAKVDDPHIKGSRFDDGTAGAITVFAMLAVRLDPIVAMDATDGWSGDAFVAAQRPKDHTMCISLHIRAQQGKGDALRTAFEQWRGAMPAAAFAKVGGSGDDVLVESCDPGPAPSGIGERFSDGILYPVVRLQIADSVVGTGISKPKAVCIGDHSVRKLTLEDLQSEELSPDLQRKLEQAGMEAARSC
jgi:hypothetical protein